MATEVSAVTKTYEFLRWLIPQITRFPRDQRFTLGQRIEEGALDILELHYIRYVDDFVLLGDDKATLWEYRDAITAFLTEHLRLKLHPKKQFVCPVEIGVDFLGYRVFPEHRLLRRRNGVRFERRLRTMVALYNAGKIDVPQVQQRISSWFGHARHADTWALTAALLGKAVFSRAKAPVSRRAGWFLEQQ